MGISTVVVDLLLAIEPAVLQCRLTIAKLKDDHRAKKSRPGRACISTVVRTMLCLGTDKMWLKHSPNSSQGRLNRPRPD